jgi:TolB-like protein/Flp pilus assembly protein TadD
LEEFPVLRLTLFGGFSAAGADGAEIPLKSRKAKALLAYLALPPGKARSREEIMALLWSDRGEAQARASLRQVLTGLRKELGEDAMAALNITDDAVSLDPDKVIVANNSAGEELLAGFHLHDPAFEEWLRDERLRLDNRAAPDIQPAGLPLPDKPSIAVLPFTNMSGDPEQEYFSDGITEDIITELSRFRDLFVIARHSSFAYRDKAATIEQVGRDLGVHYLLEGSVRKAGNTIRVSAQLVDAMTSHHLWAERYDRELEDIFAVQDEITQTIVATLAGRVEDATRERAKRKSTDSLAAYDYVLRGDENVWVFTKERTARSRQMYLKAIELDPQYARAYAGVALSYLSDWGFAWSESPDDDLDRAFQYSQKAVTLNDSENHPHCVLAYAHMFRQDFAQAKVHQEKAVALNPNDADVIMQMAFLSSYLGEHEEAIEMGEEAIRLNPYHPPWYLNFLGSAYYLARRYHEAIPALERARDALPDTAPWLAASYAQTGRFDEARAEIANFVKSAGAEPWWLNVPESTEEVEDDPTGILRYMVYMYPLKNPADLDHLLDGLRKTEPPK